MVGNFFYGFRSLGGALSRVTELLWGDSNDVVKWTYDTLVSECFTAYHETPLVQGAVRSFVDNVVGHGLTLQSTPDARILGWDDNMVKTVSDEIEARFDEWAYRNDFYAKQIEVYKSSKIRGDSLLFIDYDKGNISIRAMENNIISSKNDSNTINGVQVDELNQHNGLNVYIKNRTSNKVIPRVGEKSGRINYVLFFKKEFPNQLRGYPLCYSVLNTVRNWEQYLSAETKKSVLASKMFTVLKSDNEGSAKDVFSRVAGKINNDDTGDADIELKEGTATKIGAGEDLRLLEVNRASQEMKTFFEVVAQIISVSTGIPTEQLLRRYMGSYTASLGARMDAMMSYIPEQRAVEKNLCDVVFREWLRNEILEDRIKTIPSYDKSDFSFVAKAK